MLWKQRVNVFNFFAHKKLLPMNFCNMGEYVTWTNILFSNTSYSDVEKQSFFNFIHITNRFLEKSYGLTNFVQQADQAMKL